MSAILVGCQPERFALWKGSAAAVGAAAVSLLRQIAEGVNVAEVLTALDIDDYCGVEGWRVRIVPEKEFLTVALEGHFDEVRHGLLRPRAQTQELLAAPSHQLFGTHLP